MAILLITLACKEWIVSRETRDVPTILTTFLLRIHSLLKQMAVLDLDMLNCCKFDQVHTETSIIIDFCRFFCENIVCDQCNNTYLVL